MGVLPNQKADGFAAAEEIHVLIRNQFHSATRLLAVLYGVHLFSDDIDTVTAVVHSISQMVANPYKLTTEADCKSASALSN